MTAALTSNLYEKADKRYRRFYDLQYHCYLLLFFADRADGYPQQAEASGYQEDLYRAMEGEWMLHLDKNRYYFEEKDK